MNNHRHAALAAAVLVAGAAPALAAAAPGAGAVKALLLERSGFLVLGAVFLVLGLATIGMALAHKELRHGVALLFGVMSLLWGLRFVCRAPVVPLLVGGSEDFWPLFTRFLTYVSAPPAFGVVWRIFGPGWRGSLRWLTWLSAAFALAASALLLVEPDPDLLIHGFNVMMIGGGLVIAANLLRPESRHNPELRTLLVGGLASLVIIVRENLRSLGLAALPYDLEWAAVVILYASLGRMSANHVVGAERRLTEMQQDLMAARRIQESILPPGPPVVARLAIASRYVPMAEVAGDFFDFAELEGGRCGVLVADVSGHGVPAALVASMVKVAFQAQAGHHDDPAAVLAGMNHVLGQRLEGRFVTAGYACIDPAGGTLRYAGAGHPPLVLVTADGAVEPIAANGMILGILPGTIYKSAERPLVPGDRIVMHTDGVVEAFNAEEEDFGDARLHALLLATLDRPAEACADRILEAVKAWAGVDRTRGLEDDLTLVVVDVLG